MPILLTTLTYAFGISLANYLGKPFRTESFWMGLLIVLFLQVAMNITPRLYSQEPLAENETRAERLKKRTNLLYISIASLGFTAIIAYTLYNLNQLPLPTFYFLLLSILLIIVHSTPPLRLINRGFGELLLAVQVA